MLASHVQQLDFLAELGDPLRAEFLIEQVVIEPHDDGLGARLSVVLRARVQDDPAVRAVVYADQPTVLSNRPGRGEGTDAQLRMHVVDDAEGVLTDSVALVHEREDRESAALADAEQLARLALHALPVVEKHDGAVGGGQRAVRVLGEILVPGRVEQIDAEARIVEVQHARGDRDAAFLLHGEPVRRRVTRGPPRFHRPCQVNCATEEQQLLR